MVHPILIDSRPPFLDRGKNAESLLLTPVGRGTLCALVQSHLTAPAHGVAVVTDFDPTPEYLEKIHAACGDVTRVLPMSKFRTAELFEPSDWLLFVDPRCYSPRFIHLSAALRDAARAQSRATHLVAMSRSGSGTNERVELADGQRIRRIQRYYDSTTWPFLDGVACSLVSGACLRTPNAQSFRSLSELRSSLTARGIASRDVSIEGPVFDLTREEEFIRLNEEIVLEAFRGSTATTAVASGATVHSTARLVGPVIVQSNATIEAQAVVVGPAVIGAGARIGEAALVVQSVVACDSIVRAGEVVRSRLVVDGPIDRAADERAPRTLPSASLRLHSARRHAFYRQFKNLVDRVVALAVLAVMSPLMLVLAAIIKLESRGPVLFGDLREGEGGKPFRCLKFRTMTDGSHLRQRELQAQNQVDGPQFKLRKDPRLTRVGRWIRPMSLDELPQLFNVFAGQMSLIGPRPSPFRENQTCVPWREARLSVRPGITGLWQVCRRDRQDGDFHQWIYFDLLYVQHMSWWLDVKIAVATFVTGGGQSNVPVHFMIPAWKLKK